MRAALAYQSVQTLGGAMLSSNGQDSRNAHRQEAIPWGEWLWIARWLLLLLVLIGLPYVIASLFPPEGVTFLGAFGNADDTSAYLSAMREGARGGWLRHYPFTSEPHEPALYFPFYVLLGKLFGPSLAVFHGTRMVCTLLLVLAIYRLVVLLFPDRLTRRTALLLTIFSGGLGWLLVLIGVADRFIPPLDIRWPQATTFLGCFISPHVTLGTALELAIFLLFLLVQTAGPTKRILYTLFAALAHLGLSLVLPFSVVTVSTILIAYPLVLARKRKEDALEVLRRSLLVVAPVVPISLYYLVLFRAIPFWERAFLTMADDSSPHPLALALGYGIVALLAIAGLLSLRQRELSPLDLFLPTWMGINLVLIYLPLRHQGRFAQGYHVALSFLAAAGLCHWFLPKLRGSGLLRGLARYSTDPELTLRNVVIILTVPSSLIVSLLGFKILATEHYFPYFLPNEEVAAASWLGERVSFQDVILSSYAIGNYIPGHIDSRVFLGYRFETLDWEKKRDLLIEFYNAETEDEFRRKLISAHGITYLYHGPDERRLGDFDPSEVSYLSLSYARSGVHIYKVEE
jgi:hypothetical protein